jgi:hypothetical protein
LWGLLVHNEGLYAWNEVATFSSFLVACNLRSILTPHHHYKEMKITHYAFDVEN